MANEPPSDSPDVHAAAVAVIALWDADQVEDDDMSVAIDRLRKAIGSFL